MIGGLVTPMTFGSPDVFAIVIDVFTTTHENGPLGSFHVVVGGERVGNREGDEFLRIIARHLEDMVRDPAKRRNDLLSGLPAEEVFSRVWGEQRPADFSRGDVSEADFARDVALEPLRSLTYDYFFDGIPTVLIETAGGTQRLIWKDQSDHVVVREALIPLGEFERVVRLFAEWAAKPPPPAAA
jgi:hypothetical protein